MTNDKRIMDLRVALYNEEDSKDYLRKESELPNLFEVLTMREDGLNYHPLFKELVKTMPAEDIQKMWDYAYDKTEDNAIVIEIPMLPMGLEELVEMGMITVENQYNPFVISNRDLTMGASAVLWKINELCSSAEDQFIILPTSKHEMMVIPFNIDCDLKGFAAEKDKIDNAVTPPETRLISGIYTYTYKENKFEYISASA